MGVTPDYVLWEMSYENVLLYSHATPTYESDDEADTREKKGFKPALDANNPENFKDAPDEELITDLKTLF